MEEVLLTEPPSNQGVIVVLSEIGSVLGFVEINVSPISVGELLVIACHQIDELIVPSTMWLYNKNGAPFKENNMIPAGTEVVLKSTKDAKREKNMKFNFVTLDIDNNNNNPVDPETVFISFQDAEIPVPICESSVDAVTLRTQICSLLGLNNSEFIITDIDSKELATVVAGDRVKLIEKPKTFTTDKIPYGYVTVSLQGSEKTTLVPVWSARDSLAAHSLKRFAWRNLRLMQTALEQYLLIDVATNMPKEYYGPGDKVELRYIPKKNKKLQPVRVSVQTGDCDNETNAIFIDVSDEVTRSMKAATLVKQARAKLGLTDDVRVVLNHRGMLVNDDREIMPGTRLTLRVYGFL